VVAESIAGDTAIGHGWAYCMAVESLCGTAPPPRAEAIRAVALELERLSNHVGDLGALCNDIGYLPGSAYFGRLRGEFLNLLMEISGNRFGRGLLIPGGVRFDLTDAMRGDAIKRLARAEKDLGQVAQMIFESNSIVTRFEKTGTVHNKTARELGLVGPSGRASGCDRDVRRDHPYGLYKEIPIPVAVRAEGDVMSRAVVRWLEIGHSLEFLKKVLDGLPRGPLAEAAGPMKPDALTVAMIEGWRGEIVHVAATDESGRLDTFKIVDPSFHNWFGLTMAIRANQISDFPLCNKSFNLSYAGHDL
jgi:Ni,Fe-hydrogenase III large subunit